MNDRYLEWGPARHRTPQDQPVTGSAGSTLMTGTPWPAGTDQRDADRDRPDDN